MRHKTSVKGIRHHPKLLTTICTKVLWQSNFDINIILHPSELFHVIHQYAQMRLTCRTEQFLNGAECRIRLAGA